MNHIQSDRFYSGGVVRRIIAGLIFNNDAFNWLGIDLELEVKLIKPNHNYMSPTARKTDLELLLSSKHDAIQNWWEKLIETYKILNILFFEKQEQSQARETLRIFNKYKKFFEIAELYKCI